MVLGADKFIEIMPKVRQIADITEVPYGALLKYYK